MSDILFVGAPAGAPVRAEGGQAGEMLRNRRVQFGLLLVLPIIVIAVVGSFVAPHDPSTFIGLPFRRHVSGSLFGTDNLGRDVFSRVLAGGWSLILLAAAATGLGVAVGASLGSFSAYVGGRVDEILMRSADVALAFPPIVLALMLLSLLGPREWLIVVVVALGHAPRVLRVIRGVALEIVERDFIKYSHAIGTGWITMIRREILPNVLGPLMVEFGIRFTYSMGLIAGLSFLGMGIQPPSPDWGRMISENRVGLTVQPWGVLLPVLAIALIAIGSNLVADGIAHVGGRVESRTR